ncbi:DeoR/GlpR family DNA-binding transcription regulator [uncultured Selenomonas sp.]|uniref:DeoR/GlpR family DNA-binding transcription regulator n=1 Tax=uncultured Selenomonas sp. TaxID=159275 RepID=UPI0025DC2162|nr:DeoR/GlpR family DNA-binding transcription regulator [uncultured Selenomonas sp.]
MFLEERQEAILNLLARDGKVRVKDLSEMFKVTEDCIRKDLGALEKQGKLKRTYGGAVVRRENLHMLEVSKHRNTDVEAKRRIAQAAVKLIHDKDMVFLDISTSNLAIAELLVKTDREMTVVTNMIDILVVLARNPKIRLVFAGGKINKSRDGFWGGMTLDFISKLKPDIRHRARVEARLRRCRGPQALERRQLQLHEPRHALRPHHGLQARR